MSIATMIWRARPRMMNGLVWIMICSTRETSRHCVTRSNRLIRDRQIVLHGKTSIMLQIFDLQKKFSVVLHWHREPDGVDIRYRTRCAWPCCIYNEWIWTQHAAPEHDDVIKWKHFPRYWPFVRGIHRSPVNSPHKGKWLRALMFSLIGTWINGWVNKREAADSRLNRAHYDVIVVEHRMGNGDDILMTICDLSWVWRHVC